MKKRQVVSLLFLTVALMLTFAAAADCETRDARILLMHCYQQEEPEVRSEAVFLDEDGGVWQYQSEELLPQTEEERLAFLEECGNVTVVQQLSSNRVYELESLIHAMGEPQLEEQPCERNGFGVDTYTAVRSGSDGKTELITLAATGDTVVENLEPNAYALYVACFTEVMGYDPEGEYDYPVKPMNTPSIPLTEFLGIDEGVFDGAVLTVGIQDCEAGYIDCELEEEEITETMEWLSGLTVTGKRNALCVTGNTDVYRLCSPEGDVLARFEFYDGLLVTGDGMYTVETPEA